jgi:hypothetical protein
LIRRADAPAEPSAGISSSVLDEALKTFGAKDVSPVGEDFLSMLAEEVLAAWTLRHVPASLPVRFLAG